MVLAAVAGWCAITVSSLSAWHALSSVHRVPTGASTDHVVAASVGRYIGLLYMHCLVVALGLTIWRLSRKSHGLVLVCAALVTAIAIVTCDLVLRGPPV
jgi:hypothetical protein